MQESSRRRLDYRIPVSELNKAMKRLNTKSAPGADKISGKHLCAGNIELRQVFILFLNKLFSHTFQPHTLPEFSCSYIRKGRNMDAR